MLSITKMYDIYFNILISLLIGFLLAYYYNFLTSRKGYRLQELILLIKGNCYHIHHFMYFGSIIISMIIARSLPETSFTLLIAFLLGISLEDLLFKDWNIIKNNCHKSKLIKFMKHTTDVNAKYN